MADNRTRPVSRVKPATIFSAVAVGAVTASIGIAGPAVADQDYPSWADVQNAKKNESTKQAEIDKIGALLAGLQAAAAEASKRSQIAGEAFRLAQDALDTATAREDSLKKQAVAAAKKAETSKMRAGLLAAHLARNGGQDLSVNLFLKGAGADDLLHQLGTASKLSEQSETIYRQAIQDANTSSSLGAQAEQATAERERLAVDAKTKFDTAQAAAQLAVNAADVEQRKSDELFAQLAELKDSTAELERQRAAGLAAEAAANTPPPAPPVGGGNSGGNPGEASQGGGNSGGGAPAPASSGGDSAPPPNASAVETAISFAMAQLGDRYELGGSGPDAWDCSGLTRAAYGAAGVYIGTHSATNQYYTMANRGRLVPFSERQRGDLVFWSSGGGDFYHVAIYVGGGQIVEAADYGKPVRVHYIWGMGDVAGYVGRPG
ncbi:C40 family peptidase [Luethyella okanaganae]|uniref:C40 family peptidase n=1 Tax=Luethyella okanaganae TaxID=69372 RepID=A0ABW1VJ51_9MICO